MPCRCLSAHLNRDFALAPVPAPPSRPAGAGLGGPQVGGANGRRRPPSGPRTRGRACVRCACFAAGSHPDPNPNPTPRAMPRHPQAVAEDRWPFSTAIPPLLQYPVSDRAFEFCTALVWMFYAPGLKGTPDPRGGERRSGGARAARRPAGAHAPAPARQFACGCVPVTLVPARRLYPGPPSRTPKLQGMSRACSASSAVSCQSRCPESPRALEHAAQLLPSIHAAGAHLRTPLAAQMDRVL